MPISKQDLNEQVSTQAQLGEMGAPWILPSLQQCCMLSLGMLCLTACFHAVSISLQSQMQLSIPAQVAAAQETLLKMCRV